MPTLSNTETGEQREIPVSGAFIAIGHEPQSELVKGQIDLDENGYVVTEGKSTRTNCPGVFAAGDLVDHTYRQAITAAGSGCEAALDAEWYLRDTPEVPTPAGMPDGDLAEAQWAHRRPSSGRDRRRGRGAARAAALAAGRDGALELEQPALALEASAVAAERAAAAQHAMAGDDDRDRVGAEGVAGRARAARAAGVGGDLAVARARRRRGSRRSRASTRRPNGPISVQSSSSSNSRRRPAKYSSSSRRTGSSGAGASTIRGEMPSGEAFEHGVDVLLGERQLARGPAWWRRRAACRTASPRSHSSRRPALRRPTRAARRRAARAAARTPALGPLSAGCVAGAVPAARRAAARPRSILVSFIARRRSCRHHLSQFVSPSCSERRAASSEQPIAAAMSRWGRSAT